MLVLTACLVIEAKQPTLFLKCVSLYQTRPNKAIQVTSAAVTICACAQIAPAADVPDLERSAIWSLSDDYTTNYPRFNDVWSLDLLLPVDGLV